MPKNQRLRHRKSVRPGILDVLDGGQARQDRVSFLDDVIYLEIDDPPTRQPRAQSWLMWQHMVGKPYRPVAGNSRHTGEYTSVVDPDCKRFFEAPASAAMIAAD